MTGIRSEEHVREMTPGELRAMAVIHGELSKLPFEEAISVLTNALVSGARAMELPREVLLKCIGATWDGQAQLELATQPGRRAES